MCYIISSSTLLVSQLEQEMIGNQAVIISVVFKQLFALKAQRVLFSEIEFNIFSAPSKFFPLARIITKNNNNNNLKLTKREIDGDFHLFLVLSGTLKFCVRFSVKGTLKQNRLNDWKLLQQQNSILFLPASSRHWLKCLLLNRDFRSYQKYYFCMITILV